MNFKKNNPQNLVLQVKNLKTYFHTLNGVAKAVDDVSFDLKSGETLGVVGESGSGKSVMALSITQLIKSPPGKIEGGEIFFQGTDLLKLSESSIADIRGNRISMIFQEPMTSLNPLFSIGNQISEIFTRHQSLSKSEAWKRSIDMLDQVQIPSPSKRVKEFPHQLSGGMRQRVMIAMSLACHPEILIADEPTTALDVTIQAQVLDLMLNLKKTMDTAIVMITHDLGVVAEVAQKVIVMYAGEIVEEGDVIPIFKNPRHPYTMALLKSIPIWETYLKKDEYH